MPYHQQPISRLAVGLVAAGLALASCGSGGAQNTATSPIAPESTSEPAAAESTPPTTGDIDPSESEAPPTTTATDPASATTPPTTESPTTVPPATTAAPVDSGLSPAENAEANRDNLATSDDGRTTEILSLADGSITSIQRAATGDRPVLLWFWAPH